MAIRNTLLVVDEVQRDLEAWIDQREAIIGSTVRRARPVVLTALAAILALIPLTQSVFWGPMAIAMIGGLAVATIATLLLVPALRALTLPWRRKPAAQAATCGRGRPRPEGASAPGGPRLILKHQPPIRVARPSSGPPDRPGEFHEHVPRHSTARPEFRRRSHSFRRRSHWPAHRR